MGALAAACGVATTAACDRAPAVVERTVTMHVTCTPAGAPLDAHAYAVFHALGDFEPSEAALGGRELAASVGAALTEIPAATRALFVDAAENGRRWWGVGPVAADGDVDLLLLPALASCALPPIAGDRAGASLGAVSATRMIVVGGAGGAALSTAVVHLDTGHVGVAQPDLLTPRAGATITPFGPGALVAGGVDARAAGPALATAEVFDAASGGFEQQTPILLSGARAHHGAVVLGSGATALVGGVGADGNVLASMEIVDPATRTVRTAGVRTLAVGRRDPTVLRLASGEVVVAGGTEPGGGPAASIEIFAPDLASAVAVVPEPGPGRARAYAALQGGGALVVVAPAAGAPPGSPDVWWLDRDGALQTAAAVAGSLTAPRLFGGAGGAPALWTGDRWLRWDPWAAGFAELGALDDVPAVMSDAVASPDPGVAAWIDPSGAGGPAVTALRFDVRGAYASLGRPLLVADTADTAPDRLVPASSSGSAAIAFDPAQGLSLPAGAAVFVTDRTYANLTVSGDLPSGPASIVLRDPTGGEVEVGQGRCPIPWPATGGASVSVQRTGARITWSLSGGASGTCPQGVDASVRVAVGIRGAPGPAASIVRNVQVLRR